jgi:hypothetical protein
MRTTPFLLLALLGSAASAQESIYVGIGFGNFDYSETASNPDFGRVSDTALIKKFFGGFEINDYFTLEVSYSKTDDLRYEASAVFDDPMFPGSNVLVTGRIETDFTMTTFSGLGQVPFEWGALLAGLGYFSADSDYSEVYTATGFNTFRSNVSFTDDGLMAMLGIEWRFGRFGTRYGIRLEYEWWDMSDIDTSSVGLGVSYGF